MKIYYYFLFRIYRFYTDTLNEHKALLFSVSGLSSIMVYFNLFTLYGLYWALKNQANTMGSENYLGAFLGIILWILNYLLFVRPKKFLEQNFKKYWVYDLCIIGYLIATVVSFILVANYNRALLGVY